MFFRTRYYNCRYFRILESFSILWYFSILDTRYISVLSFLILDTLTSNTLDIYFNRYRHFDICCFNLDLLTFLVCTLDSAPSFLHVSVSIEGNGVPLGLNRSLTPALFLFLSFLHFSLRSSSILHGPLFAYFTPIRCRRLRVAT